jgi:hypothetical protein
MGAWGVIALLAASEARALPDGPADPENTGDGSFEIGVAYSAAVPPAFTIDQDAEVTSLDLDAPGLMHGFDVPFGVVFPYFYFGAAVGLHSGEATTHDVSLAGDYSGSGFVGEAEPDLDVLGMHARLLPAGRIPLGYAAILAGVGLGLDYWDASPVDDEDVADDVSDVFFALPVFGRIDIKPTCDFVILLGGGYNIGVDGPSYPFFSAGIAYQGCAGEGDVSYDDTASTLPTPVPYVPPAPVPVEPPAPPPPLFQEQQGSGNPGVLVRNNCDSTVTLTLSGPETQTLTIEPHTEGTLTVVPGTYSYEGSSAGGAHTSGSQEFLLDRIYVWECVTVTMPAP